MIVDGIQLGRSGITIGTVQATPGPGQGAVLDTFTESGSGLIPLTSHTPDIDPVGGGWEDLVDIGQPGGLSLDATLDALVAPTPDAQFYGNRIAISGFNNSAGTIEFRFDVTQIESGAAPSIVSALLSDNLAPPFSVPTGYNVVLQHTGSQLIGVTQVLISGAVSSQAVVALPSTIGTHVIRGVWAGGVHTVDLDGNQQSASDSNTIPFLWAGVSWLRDASAVGSMIIDRLEFRP